MENLANLIDHSGCIHSVVISWDDMFIVSEAGKHDQTMKIWDIQLKQAIETLKGDDVRVLGLAISKDDMYLVSGGDDHRRNVRLWHVFNKEECVR